MFIAFCLGFVIGATFLACLLWACVKKPDPFKLAALLILVSVLVSQWIIATQDVKHERQYQTITKGKGDRL